MANILNLITKSKSEIDYNIIQFPDGESHIVLGDINRKEEVDILCRVANANDLFILMQVGDILNRQAVVFNLYISYLMGMRMDRVIDYNQAFSLQVITGIINDMFPQKVYVVEPHSDATRRLIDNYMNPHDDVSYFIGNIDEVPNLSKYIIVLPDSGAAKRNSSVYKYTVFCSKKRDLKTGKLSGFVVENPEVIIANPNKPLIVLDDLCDGGGTFAGIAQELSKLTTAKKSIWVTHMVNPIGITTLSTYYDEVYFTNSYKNWEAIKELPDNVHVFEIV